MKRTFGKLISLALVLAMVLAMVPAVLAAAPTAKEISATPGDSVSLAISNADSSKTYYWKAAGSYSSSSSSYVTLSYMTTGGSNTAMISSGITSSTTVYVYAYDNASYADRNSTSYAVAAWKLVITPWTIKLAVQSPSSFKNILETGDSVTLMATVTGPKDEILKNNTTVTFAVDGESSVVNLTPENGGKLVVSSQTEGRALVTVTPGTKNGKVKITATVNGVTATYPSNSSTYIDVRGQSNYAITLPEAQQNMSVVYKGTVQYLTPTLTLNGSKVTNKTFKYVSKDPDKVVVNPDGSITPQVEKTTAPVEVEVSVADMPSVKTSAYISVVKDKANGISVSMDTDLGTTKFGYVAATNTNAAKKYVTTAITLSAEVSSTNDDDANRVEWKVSNEKIAALSTMRGSTVTLTAVGREFGEVTVTATIDGKSDTYKIRCWEAKAYTVENKNATGEDVYQVRIGDSISDEYDTMTALTKQPITAKLTGNKTATLYAKNFIPEYGRTAPVNGKVRFKGTIDGVDTASYIVYYPSVENGDVVTTSYASISNIRIVLQPQDATYKLNATIGSLTCSARITTNGEYLESVTWYDKNNNEVQVDRAGTTTGFVKNATSYTSTLNLAGKITEAGTYTYRCVFKSTNGSVESNTAIVTIGGDYNVNITASATSVAPGSSITLSGVAQQYNPSTKKYVDVTKSHTIIWTLSDSSLAKLSASSSTNGRSVTLTAKSGGTLKVTGTVSIDGKDYTGTKEITIKVPTADSISLSIGEDDSYVQLDGSKIVDAVKAATKGSSSSGTTLSTIAFQNPSNGDIYTNSNTTTRITYASSSSVSSGARYSSSDVSKMVFKPSTRNVANYTLDYTAYTSDGELATGKIIITGQGGSVVYHISAGESVAMQESDFLTVLRNGSTSSAKLNYVRFGTVSDSRGALYKGSTTSSGTVGTSLDCYATGQGSTGAQQLKNVNFIAGTSTAKYTVTVPFTVYGTGGQTVQGNLIVYVNDTHTIPVTGSSFKDMQIGTELLPSNASTSSSYVTITSVISGKLYSSYAGITDNTPLKTSDFGSTKYYFSGTGSIDSLYILPVADAKTVTVNYTLYDGSTTTKSSLSFKVTQLSASRNFSDVSGSTSWAANSVDFMSTNKLVNGVSNTAFGPNQTMTRAMLVTILYRAAGSPSVTGITNKFTDNKQGQYYYDAVLWAANKGVVTGASATRFDPDGKVTREQIAAILYRYAGSPTGSSTSLNSFSDSSSVSSYAVAALQWAVGKGIITGISTNGRTTLSAKNNANRAQVAVMLHRFLTFD